MTIAHKFEYVRAKDLDSALKLIGDYQGKAAILAGGSDLINWIREELIAPEALIDIKGISEFNKIDFSNDCLSIGSLVTFSDLLLSNVVREKCPVIQEMAHMVASNGVRNRATMVGNICSAIPSCDSAPILYCYDAIITAVSTRGERVIPIRDFIIAPRKTSLKADELVSRIEIHIPKEEHAGIFLKLARYKGEDLAQASVSILAFKNRFHLSLGAVAPTPIRALKIEQLLKGQKITSQILEEVFKLIEEESSPIADIRATKEYRTHMLKIMVQRGLKAAAERVVGKGPYYGKQLI